MQTDSSLSEMSQRNINHHHPTPDENWNDTKRSNKPSGGLGVTPHDVDGGLINETREEKTPPAADDEPPVRPSAKFSNGITTCKHQPVITRKNITYKTTQSSIAIIR